MSQTGFIVIWAPVLHTRYTLNARLQMYTIEKHITDNVVIQNSSGNSMIHSLKYRRNGWHSEEIADCWGDKVSGSTDWDICIVSWHSDSPTHLEYPIGKVYFHDKTNTRFEVSDSSSWIYSHAMGLWRRQKKPKARFDAGWSGIAEREKPADVCSITSAIP